MALSLEREQRTGTMSYPERSIPVSGNYTKINMQLMMVKTSQYMFVPLLAAPIHTAVRGNLKHNLPSSFINTGVHNKNKQIFTRIETTKCSQ